MPVNNPQKEKIDFLGVQWESWSTKVFWLELISTVFMMAIFFGGYIVIKRLITGRWKRRLDNWFEFIILLSLVIFTSKWMSDFLLTL